MRNGVPFKFDLDKVALGMGSSFLDGRLSVGTLSDADTHFTFAVSNDYSGAEAKAFAASGNPGDSPYIQNLLFKIVS